MKDSSRGKGAETIPNLYKLLGLSDCSASTEQIQRAIAGLESKASELDEQQSKRKSQLNQVARVARKQLLDDARRKKFDAVWRLQYAPVQAKPTPLAADSSRRRLLELLPAGSPECAFDLSAFLATDDSTAVLAERDAEYRNLLHQVISSAQDPSAVKAAGRLDSSADGASLESKVDAGAYASGAGNAQLSSVISSRKPQSLTRKVKQRQSILVPIIGALACTAIVMALAAYLMRKEGKSAIDASVASNAAAENEPKASPRRSGLPQVPGLDGQTESRRDAAPELDGNANSSGDQMALDASEPTSDLPFSADKAIVHSVETGAMVGSDSQMGQAAVGNPNMEKMEAAEQFDAHQLNEWRLALAGIGSALTDYQYEAARSLLNKYSLDRLPPDLQPVWRRTNQIIELAEQGHTGLVAAIEGLGPAEVFTVGTSVKVSFVEGDATRVVVKLREGRREYPLSELPPGMLYSLLDMSLDMENATALAQRGAFIMFQKNRSNRTLSKARELIVNASASPVILDDLSEIFSDGLISE